jgi:hypothetical protein
MKKNLLAILVMLTAVVTISSGCYEHMYYHEHHRHSDRYYHHRHMDPPAADVHIDVR